MAETDSTILPTPIPTSLNVTALAKQFGVARTTIQRRLKKGWAPPAQVPRTPRTALSAPAASVLRDAAPGIASTAAAMPHHRIITLATLVAALALAACSAGFSIYGLTSIFIGAFWPIVGMGAAFELGKLSVVAWLGQRHGALPLRLALVTLVGALMVLTSVGIYGYLARSHIAQTVTVAVQVDSKAADVKARIDVQQGVVADLDRRIAQLDGMVQAATKRGRTRTAMRLVGDQAARRADLERQREEAAAQLAQLQVKQAAVNSERMQADADMGPIRYISTLIGTSDEATMRWFILAVALLLDPGAVVAAGGNTAVSDGGEVDARSLS